MRRLAAALLAMAALALVGCAREPKQPELDFQVEQRVAASRAGLTLARAREIVAAVDEVAADEVSVMHRSVRDGTAMILAAVPPPKQMITSDPLETIDMRWDLERELPTLILWSERLQVGLRREVPADYAREVAAKLLDRWLPEAVGEIETPPAVKVEAPVYVVSWQGMIEGHMTGDRALVQVSSVTGLPISFSQRIAQQRPSPDEIKVTRDEALQVVRDRIAANVGSAEGIPLVAKLSLSAEAHPEGGPAWVVAMINDEGRQMPWGLVDAMTGELLTLQKDDNERPYEVRKAPFAFD